MTIKIGEIRSIEVKLAYKIRSQSEQLYVVTTIFENMTKQQFYNSIMDFIGAYCFNFGAYISYIEMIDFNTREKLVPFGELAKYPGPVTSSEELKEYERKFANY